MKNPFDYFDAIYCINLDRRTDRWEHMLIQFEKLGITDRVQRFSAIDCATNQKRKEIAGKVYGIHGTNIKYKWPLPAAVGCATSHREILIKAHEDKLKNVLVLEDDVVVSEDWLETLCGALETLDGVHWDLFYLGWDIKNNGLPYKDRSRGDGNFENKMKKVGDYLKSYSRGFKHKGVQTTRAIAYNSNVFDRLIESINPFNRRATGRVGHFDIGLRRMGNLKRFMCNPPCLEVCGGSLGVGDIHNESQLKQRRTREPLIKIKISELNYYFLTMPNPTRKDHMENEFKTLNLIEVNPILNIEKYKSGASGFSKILDLACQNQDRTQPFQPFVILEDDVKKFREFPHEIQIPEDADILYVGLTTWGMGEKTWVRDICFKNINDDVIRVYNMLASHGIMICSMRGMLAMQKCMMEDYFKNRPWDVSISQIQFYLNVYALKVPLVYQYGKIGGQEEPTKIKHDECEDNPIPTQWINKTNVSIITNYEK